MNWKVTVRQKIFSKIHQKVRFKRQKKKKKKNEKPSQYTTEKNPTQQTGEKRKLKIFDFLNSEQDTKKCRN